jgi:hypothetical protein
MKRLKAVLTALALAAIMLLTQTAFPVAALAEGGEQGYILGDDVKFRTEPGTDSAILSLFPANTPVTVLGDQNGWFFVSYGMLRGYVRQDYVYSSGGTGRAGYVMADEVNVREKPDESSLSLFTISAGSGMQISGFENGFYQVLYDGASGFVAKQYVMLGSEYKEGSNLTVLRSGMKGDAVSRMQKELKSRGFYNGNVNGEYGDATQKAIRDFQKAANLPIDGICGETTTQKLYEKNGIARTIAAKSGVKGKVKMTEWDTVNKTVPRGATYKVIDCRTGISWTEKRHGGWYHMDTEPLTKGDTAKLKQAYGGKWSWDRRSVWVVYRGYVWAASMNGMPHTTVDSLPNNDFSGHHCIHFLKSKVHETGREDARHQSCVRDAYNRGK